MKQIYVFIGENHGFAVCDRSAAQLVLSATGRPYCTVPVIDSAEYLLGGDDCVGYDLHGYIEFPEAESDE